MRSMLDNPNLPVGETPIDAAMRLSPTGPGLRLAAITNGLGTEPVITAAALLWPQVEAGTLELDGVAGACGPETAGLLAAVREIVGLEGGATDAVRDDENLRKLLLAIASDARAVVVRLAIQLDRMRRADGHARATRDIWAPLANRLGIWRLKWELEDRAFRELEPDEYHRLTRWLGRDRAARERLVASVVEELRAALAVAGLDDALVFGRPKHLYSIWRKMRRKNIGPDRVYDLHAFRVLVADEADCYAALGVVHGLWQSIPGEFDDYIAAPKGNDYRSLHTAVTGPGGLPLEIQIRTHAMHEAAESGIASHWRYKEGVRFDQSFEQRLAWLRRLLEPGTPGDDPFDTLRGDLMDSRVYALTPQGRIVDLPPGATVLDFAYYVHTGLGHRCRGARIDGRIVPLTTTVTTGDRVEIITTRDGKPSRDWLPPRNGYLASTRAREKVRAWFRQHDPAAMTEPTEPDRRAPVARKTAPKPRVTGARGADDVIRIEGVGGLMTQLARCCRPLPGDAVVGYVTRGRGVSVHRTDCHNAIRLRETDADRLLAVSWMRAEGGRGFPVAIEVAAHDRDGLLAEISGALSGEKIPIRAVDAHSDRATGVARLHLTIEIADAAQLARALASIGRLPHVFSVRRK